MGVHRQTRYIYIFQVLRTSYIQVEIIFSRMKPSSFSSCPYPSLCPYLSELSLHPLQSLVGKHMYRLPCNPSLVECFLTSGYEYPLQVITELLVTPKVLSLPQGFVTFKPEKMWICILHSTFLTSPQFISILLVTFLVNFYMLGHGASELEISSGLL